MRNFLSGIGWRVKIMGLSMVFLVGMAIIGLTAGVSIYRLNKFPAGYGGHLHGAHQCSQ
jgi:hypothetical protein